MEQMLKNISNSIIQHVDNVDNTGILHGKMGLVIFFFHYVRYTGDNSFEDYAMRLIDRIQEQILQHYDMDYANGLSGIGVGIEFLSQNGFLDINTDETLDAFYFPIRREIMYQQQKNHSLYNGLCGLGQYLLYRIKCRPVEANEFTMLANQELMVFLVDILENDKDLHHDNLSDVLSFLCKLYRLDVCNPKIDRYMDKLSFDNISEEHLFEWVLALLRLASIKKQFTGLAIQKVGIALKTIESFDQNIQPAYLLWLLQCKRLILQTGICPDFVGQLDSLTDQCITFLPSVEDNLSLKGNAGVGLAIMTLAGNCDGSWLDLIW